MSMSTENLEEIISKIYETYGRNWKSKLLNYTVWYQPYGTFVRYGIWKRRDGRINIVWNPRGSEVRKATVYLSQLEDLLHKP